MINFELFYTVGGLQLLFKAYNDEIIAAVSDAIDAGYRHFDGAMFYSNETQVGEAIQAKIFDGTVQRKDLFIVSKVSFNISKNDFQQQQQFVILFSCGARL